MLFSLICLLERIFCYLLFFQKAYNMYWLCPDGEEQLFYFLWLFKSWSKLGVTGASWVNYFSRGQYLPKFQSFPPTESKTFFLPDVVCFLLFLPSIYPGSLSLPPSLCATGIGLFGWQKCSLSGQSRERGQRPRKHRADPRTASAKVNTQWERLELRMWI